MAKIYVIEGTKEVLKKFENPLKKMKKIIKIFK